ncbi:MAG: Nitrogen fixation protein VnfA [Thermoanaerobaculia bacterium]|nr:Nitrogen fixation protein VnfA [Thermoanaerobaculia bacterium]
MRVPSFAALYELSETLGAPLNLAAALNEVLEILETEFRAVAGVLALADESGALTVAAGPEGAVPIRRPRARISDTILAQVVRSGRPVAIPQISAEPEAAELTRLVPASRKSRLGREQSFLCVPVPVEGKPAGVLALLFPYERGLDIKNALDFLGVAASLTGQALRVNRLVEAERKRLVEENQFLKQELRERYDLRNLIGTSHPMREVYEKVAQVAPSATTVLIQGESGTGKELVAHAIHHNSPRSGMPFIKVNCAAMPENLVESELFGYEPGAFTGAQTLKKGRFELAHGGTLFLDEVGDLSPTTQVKLLRVLQEREFDRLGGVKPVKVDVRLITATNRNLEEAMRKNLFREDLYYRLNVFAIFLPPLRDRRTDIPLLADFFVEKYGRQHGKSIRRIATTAIDMLMSYHWPGNVRELENCLERAVLVCDGGVIHGHHLPPTLQTAEVSGTLPSQSLEEAVAAFEKDLILDSLKIARGNKARAARLLQTTERILSYKAAQLQIDPVRFKPRSDKNVV